MRLKKSDYLALEDAILDSRIPLRSEEEFRVGITFTAKLVGCGNVPRPNSRVEIVASMRKIRCDCRNRKDKKRKVTIGVSYEGVKVSLSSGKKSNSSLPIAHHPIHRIFYVSHDSLDLHIFSYIAREGSVFKCFVFKAHKQSMAVNVVRTIGQAFELCHKMTFVMNEGATNTNETNLNSGDSNEQNNCLQNQITKANKMDAKECKKENSLSQELSLNMEQMLQEVDNKLDKLSDKVELLERQISILLSNLELQNDSTKFSKEKVNTPVSIRLNDNEDDLIKQSSLLQLNNITCYNKIQPDKEHEANQNTNYLNSPDSLLSSPVLNSVGSCLLFNDLY